MDWVTLAILGTAIMGVVNILDSHMITKRMPSINAYLFPIGILIGIIGLVFFLRYPLPENVNVTGLMVAIIQSLMRTGGVVLMLYAFRSEEVSRAIPVIFAYPIYVAVISIPLLGERITFLEWMSIIIVVIGAMIISVRRGVTGSLKLGKPFLLAVGAGLLFALTDVSSKYALGYLSFYNVFWISAFCVVIAFLVISLRKSTFKVLRQMSGKGTVAGIIFVNEVISVIAVILNLWALQLGPVSLVSTIGASRPIFVLLFSIILSRISPMFLDFAPGRGILLVRILATVLVVGGIVIIYLT